MGSSGWTLFDRIVVTRLGENRDQSSDGCGVQLPCLQLAPSFRLGCRSSPASEGSVQEWVCRFGGYGVDDSRVVDALKHFPLLGNHDPTMKLPGSYDDKPRVETASRS